MSNSWVRSRFEMLRLPRAQPQTRPDARTRNLSKLLLTQELCLINLQRSRPHARSLLTSSWLMPGFHLHFQDSQGNVRTANGEANRRCLPTLAPHCQLPTESRGVTASCERAHWCNAVAFSETVKTQYGIGDPEVEFVRACIK